MKVNLIYFKRNGKYYHNDSYDTKEEHLFMIWDEVRNMRRDGKLPGLVDGAREFIISIDVPDHPYNHPHLIM